MPKQNPLKFLRTQKLYILKPGLEDARKAAVHPEGFREERLREQSAEKKPDGPNPDYWAPISRGELTQGEWQGQSLRLTALTTDAGLGKSYNCRALCHALNQKPHIAFKMDLGELVTKKVQSANFLEEYLLDIICNAQGTMKNRPRILQALKHKQQAGQISLIFDGLDQSPSSELIHHLLQLGEWQSCRFVVAGRPFAIEKHWNALFENRPWQFVQIGKLDEEQQQSLLGQERWEAIPKEARQILEIPRVLEFLADPKLPINALKEMKTLSDVYYAVTEHLLIEAYKNKFNKVPNEDDVVKYRMLLGAFAFQMYADVSVDKDGVRTPNLDRIDSGRAYDFRHKQVRPCLVRALRGEGESYGAKDKDERSTFNDDCEELSSLNAEINHGWLDSRDAFRSDLLWRNASLQEFMAAYWASRYGQPEDHAHLHEWIVDPLTGTNRAFYWFWRYATEMPDRVIRTTDRQPRVRENWVNCMAPLYAVPAPGKPVIRSTEFVYRSWERMKGTIAQKKFLAEFPAIFNSKSRKKEDVRRRKIAQEMMAGFITLAAPGSKLPGDTGTFWMGASKTKPSNPEVPYDDQAYNDESPPHGVSLSSYKLHKYCVRNVEYELFDEQHMLHRWANQYMYDIHVLVKVKGQGADDDCPVVNVSWYDAWVFAAWCGSALPTEAQWEYACRAGTKTKFSLRDYPGDQVSKAICNYEFSRSYTLPVDDLRDNRWGFFHMHGNVLEWCQDWYDKEYYQKSPAEDPAGPISVLKYCTVRGGSWSYSARDCRAACRYWLEPGYRNRDYGFRLACLDLG